MSRNGPILVAGRTGQLAQALTELAARRRVRLVAVGRPDLNIESANSVEAQVQVLQPAMIVNAAAYTAVDLAETEPARAFAVNRGGAAQLAKACARLDIPHIHISSDYVFDGRKASPYCEQDAPAPLGVYGCSKLEGERAVCEAYPAALVLRTSWVYSPWGNNFLRTMLRLARTHERVRVVDDQRGAPTSARDLAAAILDIAAQLIEGRHGGRAGVYHLTAGGETTWHGFAKAIFAGWSRRGQRVPALTPIATADYPTAARRPANSRLDCARIKRDFGIQLPHWQDSLEACLDELADSSMEIASC